VSTKAGQSRVCADFNRHTCIEVSRAGGLVKHIPLNIAGMELLELNSDEFDRVYQPLKDYPVEKAAQLYAEYAAQLGGTKEAMQALASIIPLTSKEIDMATAKKAASAATKTEAAAKAKATSKTAAAPKAEKPAKAAPAAKPAKEAKAPAAKAEKKAPAGEKKPSAANMFKDLIMAGKLTDDQIFEKVQKEFGLDDNKRSYVKWYRNDLTKKGMNPPAAKA
jgi:hypothetical protein